MKSRFSSAYSDETNSTILKTAGIVALILLFFLLIFPSTHKRDTASPPVSSQPAITNLNEPVPVVIQAHIKESYLAAEPEAPIPPAVTATPWPTPTPAGGGVLRKIAFTSNRADGHYYQLYMMDADGTHLERLTQSQAFDRDSHFSYDGKLLAFASNRNSDMVYQIFILDLETRTLRQITFDADDKTNPFWSPDDRHILYTLHRNDTTVLAIMQADGGEPQLLEKTRGDSHGYGFSPNGREVSFESTLNRRNEIFVYNLSTKEPSTLIHTDELSYRGDPVFSPAGHNLVFTSDVIEHKLRQLYIYDLDWKKYYRISDDDLDKDDPIFSPDGTKIAYVARWENAWNIFVMDADGKHARNLTRSYYDHMVPTWR